MNKKILNEHGSTMTLVVIIIAVIIMIGTSLLNITMSQYKIRKSNTEIKRALYMSEYGLNEAYLKVYDLICDASRDSVNKADEYLLLVPDDLDGASLLFKNNYKQYILISVVSSVIDNSNPYIDITNKTSLAFIYDKLAINVRSKYISEIGIEKNTSVDIIVSVPDYIETKNKLTIFKQLLQFRNFNL